MRSEEPDHDDAVFVRLVSQHMHRPRQPVHLMTGLETDGERFGWNAVRLWRDQGRGRYRVHAKARRIDVYTSKEMR